MFGFGIALGILALVCLHAAVGSHRAGCDRRDTYWLAGLGIASSAGATVVLT